MNKDSGELNYDELNSHIKTLNSVIEDYEKKTKELKEKYDELDKDYSILNEQFVKSKEWNLEIVYSNKFKDKEIEQLQAKIDELEKANTNLEMQKSDVELENKDIKSILIKMSDKVVYTEQDRKDFWEFECECGFKGFSIFLLGGGQIADTGDFGDVFCPCCNKNH